MMPLNVPPTILVITALGLVGGGIVMTLYTYLLYPVALYLLGRWAPGQRLRVRGASTDEPTISGGGSHALPTLSITVPVYNEEDQVRGLIENLLALDYPPELRQILIVSDASTDQTDEIVREFADQGIELLRLEERGGKTAAENAARDHLLGEIIVNTDASVRMEEDTLLHLVAPFADPAVGVVSARDLSVTRVDEDANRGERSEEHTSELQSRGPLVCRQLQATTDVKRRRY